MLYPQNGDCIVATDSVTSRQPMYNGTRLAKTPYATASGGAHDAANISVLQWS